MKIFKVDVSGNFDNICKQISPELTGLKIMKEKSHLNFFYIKDIKRPAANILKQDALGIGAELVCSKNAILGGNDLDNALLIANNKQMKLLAKKEILQDFGLKSLGEFLNINFKKPDEPQIMGVLNFNEDSFNEASRTRLKDSVFKIEKMISDGAKYIDIGMVSSRPKSEKISSSDEFKRVKPVVDEIYRNKLFDKVSLSLDSYDETCLKYALDRGFKMINDISANCSLAKLAMQFDAQYCLMHMKGTPKTMQDNVEDSDILDILDDFFKEKLKICEDFGAKKIFLDVGIGFGKTPRDNMILIKHLEHFLHFGYPLFIGANRKSLIDFYSKSSVEDRLPGSLFLHLKAFENGATIIRTHDVSEHVQMFKMMNIYKNLGV